MQNKIGLSKSAEKYFQDIFAGIELENRAVLDIGSGSGKLAAYIAKHTKAKRVLCLDNYCGNGSDARLLKPVFEMSRASDIIKLAVADINKFETSEKFDYITLFNTLHHLFITSQNLVENKDAYKYFARLFKKLGGFLEKDGRLIIIEISPLNLLAGRLLLKQVEWKTKHFPFEWEACLKSAGFTGIRTRYLAPTQLFGIPFHRELFNNPLASPLLLSTYSILAGK